MLAYVSSGSFVAEQESERFHGLNDSESVIITGIRACAKYTCQPGTAHKQTSCRTEKVALHRHWCTELCHQRRFHYFVLLFGRASGSIKVQMLPTTTEKGFRQFKPYAVGYLAARLKKRIQPRSEGMFDDIATVDQCPLRTRSTAFSYKLHSKSSS